MRWHVFLVAPLLSLPGLVPGDDAPGDAGAPWVLEDPRGDQHHVLTDAANAPPNALMDAADVLKLELRDENASALTLAFTVAELDETLATAQSGACFGLFLFVCYRVDYDARFSLNEDDGREYVVNADIFYIPAAFDEPVVQAYMYSYETYGDRFEFGDFYELEGSADFTTNEIRVVLPRDAIHVGRGDERHPAGAGDRLTGLQFSASVYAYAGLLLALPIVYFVDDVPNDGDAPAYTFQESGQAGELLVETDAEHALRTESEGGGDFFFTGERNQDVALAPGQVREIGFHVTNRGEQKRILALAATLEAPSAGWNATVVPQIIVGANETVRVGVLVHAPDGAAHREAAPLTLSATALDDASVVASADLRVYAARTPTLDSPTLALHSQQQHWSGAAGAALDGAVPLHQLVMNVLRDDDAYDDTPVSLVVNGYSLFELDTPLADPLSLDPDGAASLTLRVVGTTPAPTDVDVEASLVLFPPTGDALLLADGGETASLSQAGSEITLSMPISDPSGVYEAGQLALYLGFRSGVPLFNPTFANLDVGASSLTLPVVPLPSGHAAIGTSATGLRVALSLGDERDPVEYVNPGETRRFNLTARNEESDRIEVSWKVEASERGWSVWTEGPAKAAVDSGNATGLVVYVRAPEDAEEGRQVALNVTATPRKPKGDASEPVAANLRVIVTRGIDLPDDAAQGPALKPKGKGKGLPGPDAGLLALALVGAVAMGRRRRPAA